MSTPKRSGHPARRGASSVRPAPRKATARDWVSGARLRTLPLAVAPVLVGTGAGVATAGASGWSPVLALLCLVVALCLQIGVNYSNDYSDGIRGTDEHRVGPARLTGSGVASPKRVLAVALAFFALAAIAGLVITVITQAWWLIAVGAVAIVAAWFYTGGKRPYGYFGLGELFVFVFFGLVATCGSAFVQSGTIGDEAWMSGIGVGLIACAVLMANNLRDVEQDRIAGKRTLAVLVGPTAGRVLFCVFLLLPFVLVPIVALIYPLASFTAFALLAALPACIIVVTARQPRELILALQLASITALLYGAGLGAAFAF
ncbi:1,4-dihydroxy-2-naphthoate polyprenyltransferase [Agromyces atrinae]|uniref:1,4-dihydroxy-2-naphthoate octaprenyltransferase n=1 Tax=Agromyces atrinae TaxID=592376 RepID=A0A4Q2M8V1_9MICO|nr:1,4-dihydroxy-2-naphthoate octaprenyltransferase [Agromyces atrinae]RXZ86813.1 1,4-dihydroxy-2-naphthoate polyprenyltransferase [Agromyces atrinae]